MKRKKEKKPTPTEVLRGERDQARQERDYWRERYEATLEARLETMSELIRTCHYDVIRAINR